MILLKQVIDKAYGSVVKDTEALVKTLEIHFLNIIHFLVFQFSFIFIIGI